MAMAGNDKKTEDRSQESENYLQSSQLVAGQPSDKRNLHSWRSVHPARGVDGNGQDEFRRVSENTGRNEVDRDDA